MHLLEEISMALQNGRKKKVEELVAAALEEGIDANVILEDGLMAGMLIIGKRFREEEIFVPDVMISARCMNSGAALLKPYLMEAGQTTSETVILGTVKDDLHDIGKNLVRMMMEAKGLNVIDLGVDVETEAFVDSAIEHNAKLICCSALLTTTMYEMQKVVDLCKERGIRDKVKIMIGGAPINQDFCDEIGADCYTKDATSAAEAAMALVS